jgi:hypothetical protein
MVYKIQLLLKLNYTVQFKTLPLNSVLTYLSVVNYELFPQNFKVQTSSHGTVNFDSTLAKGTCDMVFYCLSCPIRYVNLSFSNAPPHA